MRIVLITSSVNVLAKDSKFAEPISREIQTYLAINKFIDNFDIVYLVDGSNYNFELIDQYISKENLLKIRIHSFQQDLANLGKYGKALGELLVYKEFLKITKGTSVEDFSVVKISGRWFMNNFSKFERLMNENNNLFVQYYPKMFEFRRYVQTCFYKMEYSRLEKLTKYGLEYYLIGKNETQMEIMLYDFLQHESKIFINMDYPDYSGVVSGSRGTEIKSGNYYKIQHILSKYFKQYCFKLS